MTTGPPARTRLPAAVQRQADEHQLGPLVTVLRSRTSALEPVSFALNVGTWVLVFLGPVVALLIIRPDVPAWRYVVGSVAFLLLVFFTFRRSLLDFVTSVVRYLRERIYLFGGGFVDARRAPAEAFAWRDVDLVHRDEDPVPGEFDILVVVRRKDGHAIALNFKSPGAEALRALDTALTTALREIKLPETAARVQAGEVVEFGPIRLSLRGIAANPSIGFNDTEVALSWPEVGELQLFDDGIFGVTRRTGDIDLPVIAHHTRDIPNFAEFWTLANQLVEQQRDA
jgi:hypothetical protein